MSKPAPAELTTLSIAQAGNLLTRGEITSTALTEAFLARIDAVDHKIASYITVTAERARIAAKQADMELSQGLNRGPLHGIPIALKDIYETEGVLTTGHSHLRADYVPAVDAETVRRLKAGGAVILGKLATHEFANGAMTPDQPFPAARNPWNTDYQPGGSSSGSGAAVAAAPYSTLDVRAEPWSFGSWPASTSSISAQSSVVQAMGPAVSRLKESGKTPQRLTRP